MGFPWLKLKNDFAEHVKTQNLCDELGDENAGMYLVRLWAWANESCPTGLITALNPAGVIERVCRWRGQKGRLVQAFVKVGWLDQEDTGLYIHDWHDHQGRRIAAAEKDAETARERRKHRRSPSVGPASDERRDCVVNASADENTTRLIASESALSLSLSLSSQEGVQGEKPPDASDLEQRLGDVFLKHTKRHYRWQAKDYEALRAFTIEATPPDEIVSAFDRGLGRKGFPTIATVADVLRWWNHCSKPDEPKAMGKQSLRTNVSDEQFREATAHLKTDANGDLVLE